jgi:hypothetical protein
MVMKVGEHYTSNNFGEVEVIKYINCNSVEVRFSDGSTKTTCAGNIRKGEVSPVIRGVNANKIPIHDLLKRNISYSNYRVISCDGEEVTLDCSLCAKDLYSVNGISTSVFKTTRNTLREGKVPCRCNKFFRKNSDEQLFDTKQILLTLGGKLINHLNFPRIIWECPSGHVVTTNFYDNKHKSSGCPKCTGHTDNQSILYLLELNKGGRFAVKLGIATDLKLRVSEIRNSSDGINISVLDYVDLGCSSRPYEKRILDLAKSYGVMDKGIFGKFSGYTEVFKYDRKDELLYLINTIRREGDFSDYELKDLLYL